MPNAITYKCVICGAELESIGRGMGECPSCRFRQSMPTISSHKLERANKFRRDEHDFEKALQLYEEVTKESPEEADAFWGAAICKYKVDFVNDDDNNAFPTFYQKNRFRFSGMPEFKAACDNADDEQKSFYQSCAQKIDASHRKVIDVFDRENFSTEIYIRCCTDENNIPSEELRKDADMLASKLRDKDYRVFFPNPESFDIKPGTPQYEAYAHNALSSAKVMLIIGNKPEQFTNKWLKNEWTRFSVLHKGSKQCMILPIVFDMDPYDLPMELQSTQAVNWHSAEALETVLETVDKAMGRYIEQSTKKQIEQINDLIDAKDKEEINSLYNRALKMIDGGNPIPVEKLIRQILEIDPEYHKAYWLRLCLKMNTTPQKLQYLRLDISNHPDYISAIHYADSEALKHYEDIKNKCLKNLLLQTNYNNEIKNLMNSCCSMQNSQIIDTGKKKSLEQLINSTLNSDIYTSKTYNNNSIACCVILFILKIVFLIAGFKLGYKLNISDGSISISKSIILIIVFYVISALYYLMLLVNIISHQFCMGSKLIGLITGVGQIILSVSCSGFDYKGLVNIGPMLSMTLKYNPQANTEKLVSFWNFILIDILVVMIFLLKFIPVFIKEQNKKKKRQECEQSYSEYCNLLTKAVENLENTRKMIFEKYNSMKDSPDCILETVTDKSFDIICDKLKNSYTGKFAVKYENASNYDAFELIDDKK